jgi:hypothetical protein
MTLVLHGTNGITSPDGTIFSGVNIQKFTSSGTWTKPSGGVTAIVRMWGAGGSGAREASGNAGGGGGGGYFELRFLVSTLSSTETVTIGAGGVVETSDGTVGNDGGTTTFGSHATCYGGRGGLVAASGSSVTGAGSGGFQDPWTLSAADTVSSMKESTSGHTQVATGVASSMFGSCGTGVTGGGSEPVAVVDIKALYGGGGGGGESTGGSSTSVGCTSIQGGNGGAGIHNGAGVTGGAPGGGGGAGSTQGGAGGAGQVEVIVI